MSILTQFSIECVLISMHTFSSSSNIYITVWNHVKIMENNFEFLWRIVFLFFNINHKTKRKRRQVCNATVKEKPHLTVKCFTFRHSMNSFSHVATAKNRLSAEHCRLIRFLPAHIHTSHTQSVFGALLPIQHSFNICIDAISICKQRFFANLFCVDTFWFHFLISLDVFEQQFTKTKLN